MGGGGVCVCFAVLSQQYSNYQISHTHQILTCYLVLATSGYLLDEAIAVDVVGVLARKLERKVPLNCIEGKQFEKIKIVYQKCC